MNKHTETSGSIPPHLDFIKFIPLGGKNGKDKRAIVDGSRFDEISCFSWCVSSGRYATRNAGKSNPKKQVSMHRQVSRDYTSPHIDHINGCMLDNRESNLRPCSASQNATNRTRQHAKNSTGIRGVCPVNKKKAGIRYAAQININGRCSLLGIYETIEEAAGIRITAALEYYGADFLGVF